MVWLDKSYQNFQHYLHQQIHHQGSTSKATWVSWITLYIRFSFKCVEITLLPKFPQFYIFFECVKAAHNDFCTKLPNYLLYHFFSIFFKRKMQKKGTYYRHFQKKRVFLRKKSQKNYQITYITGAFIFLGRLKVAHIEPYLIFAHFFLIKWRSF